jgi:hypothetical protein
MFYRLDQRGITVALVTASIIVTAAILWRAL